MKKKLLYCFILALGMFSSASLSAQCTSSAGDLSGSYEEACVATFVYFEEFGGTQLDTNDGAWYIVFQDTNDPIGSNRRITKDTSWYIGGFQTDTMYYATLVADTLPDGEPDLNDPCLDISNPNTVRVIPIGINFQQTCAWDSIYVSLLGDPPFDIRAIDRLTGDTSYWTTNSNETFLAPEAQEVEIVVTSANGCSYQTAFQADPIDPIDGDIFGDDLSCTNTSVLLEAEIRGGNPPYTYRWINGASDMPELIVTQPGLYTLNVFDAFGCGIWLSYEVTFDTSDCGIITGNLFWDQNDDCVENTGDESLQGWTVAAYGQLDTFYATSQADGSYQILVLPDTFQVEALAPNNLFTNCSGTQEVVIENTMDAGTADFGFQTEVLCPFLTVDLGLPALRVCSVRPGSVTICNKGTEAETDVRVEINLDEKLEITSSDSSFTQNSDGTYIFPIGTLEPQTCVFIPFLVKTSCDAIIGESLCGEAIALPDTICQSPNPLWSGASLELTGECDTDSIRFSIRNIGGGTMVAAKQYIVIEDAAIMRISDPFQLSPFESLSGAVAATGATIRIEVPQEDFHPGNSMPSITLESCGDEPGSLGFVNMFSMNDGDSNIDIDCGTALNSYDPNDKLAYPLGYGSAHYVEANTDIEYRIRFQNTGNDTAYTVVLLDTLSSYLDPGTFVAGTASHPYTYEIFENGMLRFTFDNIDLPDSTTNEPASNGFVEFTISQMPDLPLGTVIENQAAIYFDQNPPIFTNTTFHTIGEDFILVNTQEIIEPGAQVNVFPNPFTTTATLELELPDNDYRNLELTIYDLAGKKVKNQLFDGNNLVINRQHLQTGFYFYQIDRAGKPVANGKMVVR
jgi:uncharacterized repeat protein (TIGR01451 family)